MDNAGIETITLGGGCFWCLEAAYLQLRGVKQVVSGYAGGQLPNPTYDQVCSGNTGHAEVVQITFNPAEVSLRQLLDIFWIIHNPTTKNRQGYDIGPQYRSIILYSGEDQKLDAEAAIKAVQKLWPDPIVTEVVPLDQFNEAEEYHQNYFARQPEAAYCQAVINPKLAKLAKEYQALLK